MFLGRVEGILKYPIVFLAGFIAAYLLTPMVRRLASACGLIDRPGIRHIHTRLVPRCGISVFIGFHIACAAIFLLPWKPFVGDLTPLWWWEFFILSSMLMALGLLDDLCDLAPLLKLAGQAIVAVIAYLFDMRVGRVLGIHLPAAADLAVTVLWFLAIINAFNLVDGIDGLATGLASIAALGLGGSFLFRHMPGDALIMFGLVGACLAFLRYNFQPASIFLGDSGSMFLGFTIASVAVSTGAKGTALASVVVPLLAVGIPIFDTFLAVWRRTVRHILGRNNGATVPVGETRIFHGDTDHVHHRLVRSGLSHRAAATWLYLASLALLGVGLLSMIYHSHAVGIYIIAFLVASYVGVRHLARVEILDSGRAIVGGMRRPASRVIAVLTYLPADIMLLAGALAVAVYFSGQSLVTAGFKQVWFDSLPLWVGVPFVAMFLMKTYHRVWSRARLSEHVYLASGLLAGILLAAGLASMLQPFSNVDLVRHILIYAGLAIPLITGIRAIPRAVEDAMIIHGTGDAMLTTDEPTHTLVHGVEEACGLYLRRVGMESVTEGKPVRVVGLLDPDRNLHGRYVFGYQVLGGLDQLSQLAEQHHVELLVLTEPVGDAVRKEALDAARECGIMVSEQRVSVEILNRDEGERAPA